MKNIAVSLILILFAAGFVNAQPRREEGKIKHKDLVERLNLSDEQKVKFQSLRLSHQKEMIDLKANLEKTRLVLREIKAKKNFSRSEYLNAVENINEAENKIALSRANHRMDIYEMLNDEQKKIFAETGPDLGMGERGDFPRKLHKRICERDCPND